ncbi:hypothetical protein ACKVWC_011613 [Pyricularia oryzae]
MARIPLPRPVSRPVCAVKEPPAHPDRNRLQRIPDGIPSRLPDAAIVDHRPADGRPAVVELPDQHPAAPPAAPLPPPAPVRGAHGVRLHHLRQVRKALERPARAVQVKVLPDVREQPPGVPAGLVAKVHGHAARPPLPRVRDRARERRHVRVRLHAELADEPPAHLGEELVRPHGAVPHVPLVHVAHRLVHHQRGAGAVAPGAAGVVCDQALVLAGAVLLLDDQGQEVFVDVPGGEVCPQPRLRVLVACKVVLQPVALHDLVVLVVPGPDDERRVVPQPPHVLSRLGLDGLQKPGVGGVVCAGEAKVLPCQDAGLVAGVEEGVGLVDAAAPDADHGLVALCHVARDPVPVLRWGRAREEAVRGDPAGPAAEHVDIVDAKVKGLPDGVFFLDELDGTKADFLGHTV